MFYNVELYFSKMFDPNLLKNLKKIFQKLKHENVKNEFVWGWHEWIIGKFIALIFQSNGLKTGRSLPVANVTFQD
jgi:hypothetical protein